MGASLRRRLTLPSVRVSTTSSGRRDGKATESDLKDRLELIWPQWAEAIPEAGRFPWWETPGEIRRILGEFLGRA